MKRYKNILYVMGHADNCELGLPRAVTLAENNQARLTIVNVVELTSTVVEKYVSGLSSTDLNDSIINTEKQRLEALINPYQSQVQIDYEVLAGINFVEIIHKVLRDEHDLVMKVTENKDWLDRLFGSDDMHLLRKCPCPVWLLKPQLPKSHQRILAAVDVDDSHPPQELISRRALNLQILEIASSLALTDFAELHIVQVWHAVGESAMRGVFMHTPEPQVLEYVDKQQQRYSSNLEKIMREVANNLGEDTLDFLKPQTHLIKGWASKEIPALSKLIDADIVVMGTVARTGVPGFIMGNTAETILNQLNCSVLALKPPGFVTPVTLKH